MTWEVEISKIKKDDVEAVRDQLKNILQDRIVFWKSKFAEIENDFEKLNENVTL